MPFFPGAKNFKIEGGEMNDVAGNMTKNVTTSNTTNSDVGNVAIGSDVSKGNTTKQDAKIGESDCFFGVRCFG
jgi:uncharacterized membrane protein YvbJ